MQSNQIQCNAMQCHSNKTMQFRIQYLPRAFLNTLCLSGQTLPTKTGQTLLFTTSSARLVLDTIASAYLVPASWMLAWCAFNQHHQRPNIDVCFRELMHRRIEVLTMICLAWAHTFQSLCLRYKAHLFEALKICTSEVPRLCFGELPTSRTTTRLVGLDCEDFWCIFTDGGARKSLRTTPLDGVMVLLAISQRHGPVVCNQRHFAFRRATGATNNSAGVTGFVEERHPCHS